MRNRLKPSIEHQANTNVWVDEAIWGHRFYNDQTPWLVLLEFLAVFNSRTKFTDRALGEEIIDGAHESVRYQIPMLSPLRQLVFNNPHVHQVGETFIDGDEKKWKDWMKKTDPYGRGTDFRYLQKLFDGFTPFTWVVEFFQSSAIEAQSNRRWSSKFIFPYGSNCLYADLPGSSRTPDRRFFARGGELLYLMLNRSGKGREIAINIENKILRNDKPWNRVVKALLPPVLENQPDDVVNLNIGYLPFKERTEYGSLADTWLSLLNLNLIGEALLDPLMRLSALHMLLYMLKRSQEEIGEEHKQPRIVLEIASDKKTPVFELSSDCFAANRKLSLRSIRAYIENIKNEDDWEQALKARNSPKAVKDLFKNRFNFKFDIRIEKPHSFTDPEDMLNALIDYAEGRHQQHVIKVHSEWSKRIGLAVARRGVGSWYSPNDSFLKAIVMCLVKDREEFHRFLEKMYEVFHLIVGVSEAEKSYDSLPTDRNAFIQNTQRLEARLKTLGLLRRLSDDCAYVENPFSNSVDD